MKKINIISSLILAFLLFSCQDHFNGENKDLYDGSLKKVSITMEVPSEYSDLDKSNFYIIFDDMVNGNKYQYFCDPDGVLRAEVPYGLYNLLGSGKLVTPDAKLFFSGTRDRVAINDSSNAEFSISLLSSSSGALIFKELYTGGSQKAPEEGTLQNDKYAILYNNSDITQYLDGICIGTADPGNATATNYWLIDDPQNPGSKMLPDSIYVQDAVLKLPGDGTQYPLAPGEQAVIVFNAGVDHSASFPQSVNLDKEGYFIVYDIVNFPNTDYHPAPGPNISQSGRYINVIRKLGIATAYSISNNSPALIIYRPSADVGSIEAYANDEKNVRKKPGSSLDAVFMKLPLDWVLDGFEVFNGTSSNNSKRFKAPVDAGYVTQSASYQSKTLYRNVDEEATLEIPGNEQYIVRDYNLGNDPSGIDAEATIKNGGRIIYMDTNNSSDDFHERSRQSLHSSAPVNN